MRLCSLLFALLVLGVLAGGAGQSSGASPALADDGSVQVTRFSVAGVRGGRESAIAVWPRHRIAKGEQLPVVFAFHGRRGGAARASGGLPRLGRPLRSHGRLRGDAGREPGA